MQKDRERDRARTSDRSGTPEWRARIGLAFKTARKAKGLSQTALGELIGCNLSTIQRMEVGEHVAEYRVIERAADALEISIDELVGRAPPEIKRSDPLALVESRLRTEIRAARQEARDHTAESVRGWMAAAEALQSELKALRAMIVRKREQK